MRMDDKMQFLDLEQDEDITAEQGQAIESSFSADFHQTADSDSDVESGQISEYNFSNNSNTRTIADPQTHYNLDSEFADEPDTGLDSGFHIDTDYESELNMECDSESGLKFLKTDESGNSTFSDETVEFKEHQEEHRSVISEILSWVIPMAAAVLVALLLKNYVIINANVPSGSMMNTIQKGDDLFGIRLAYLFTNPKRGDIIIFYYPDDPSTKYIKRIIGEPGDKVVISNAKIYINDSADPLEEDYLPEDWIRNNDGYTFQVPEDHYLMLGDNRNDSWDSRFWNNTYVSRDAIIGKAWIIYYPFDHIRTL